VTLDMPTPTAAVRISGSTWDGINEATRRRLRSNYASTRLSDLRVILRMTVVTQQWRPFSGSSQFIMEKYPAEDNVRMPVSGSGISWLLARGGNTSTERAAALAQAHIIWGELLSKNLTDLRL
jgi:hypothetical protein